MEKENKNYEVINHMMRSRIRMCELQERIIEEFISKEEKYAPLKNFGDRSYLADRMEKFLSRHLFLAEPFNKLREQAIAVDAYNMAMYKTKTEE